MPSLASNRQAELQVGAIQQSCASPCETRAAPFKQGAKKQLISTYVELESHASLLRSPPTASGTNWPGRKA
ncbi:Piso0_000065 [Millerozyma farinosa CBS 7064]|uniref:Piso0_000065 protein n=1 Tax=Pichia sorbitophila (strain ATCC MYA-4447 / BCRC 22081 / CBS 7064 / NBRC 10061 / NRRL Y-12695) TaxID=559304 RepID=G8YT03_PICSO|nr:Piso0_000065 [Millerozyma farinosa CBS 7064]